MTPAPPPATSPAIPGFSDQALGFYDGLEADNSRTYWNDHREQYESYVRAPLLALLAALEPEFGPAKVFRPYRDVRFSKDKSPYKTAAAAVLHSTDGEGSLYVQVSAAGLMTGGGYYTMSPDQVARFRAAVDEESSGSALDAVTAALLAGGYSLGGAQLRRVPRGFDPAHPRAALLKHKGLAGFRDHGQQEWLATPRVVDVVADDWRALADLNAWLSRHVGPAEPADGDDQERRRVRRVSPSG
jgi:uncharacterized protein (TIGR02453 family)